jgi:hypothetical protein
MRDVVNLTPDVVACVRNVRDGASPDYRQEKLRLAARRSGNGGPPPEELAAADAPAPPLSVAAAEEFPQLHAQQKEAIDRMIECAAGKVTEQYPLLEGESVESDFATFLTKPYFNFPEGTAVLRRTTNMAEVYYILTNVRVRDNGDLVRTIHEGRPMPRGFDPKKLATKAAYSLASSIASAVGGAFVSAFIEEFFPPGAPSYFDEVYEQMARITNKSIQEDKILSINGAINNVKQHLTDEYGVDRKTADLENEGDRERLFNYLQKYDSTFLSGPGGMIGALQNPSYEVVGFSVFLLAASLQLAVFQEMASVVRQKGRDNKWLKPHETSYGKPREGTVAITARRYAEYAEATWPKVRDARVKNIRWETYEANKRIIGGDVSWELWGRIVDNGEYKWPRQIEKQKEKDGSYPTLDHLKRDEGAYKDEKLQELTAAYNDPKAIAGLWRKLIDQPTRPV